MEEHADPEHAAAKSLHEILTEMMAEIKRGCVASPFCSVTF